MFGSLFYDATDNEPKSENKRRFNLVSRLARRIKIIFLPWLELHRLNGELPRAISELNGYAEDLYSQFNKALETERAKYRRDHALLQINHESEIADLKQQHLRSLTHVEAKQEFESHQELVSQRIENEQNLADVQINFEELVDSVLQLERARHAKTMEAIQSRYQASVTDEQTRNRRAVQAVERQYKDQIDELIELGAEEREDQVQKVKIDYEEKLERLDERHKRVISRERHLSNGLIEDFLPEIEFVKDSSDKITDSRSRTSLFTLLKNINDRPTEVKAKRVKMTDWLESTPNKTARVYFKKSATGRSYKVLVSDKKSQPRDISWMRHN